MDFPVGAGNVRDQVSRTGSFDVLLDAPYKVFHKAFVPKRVEKIHPGLFPQNEGIMSVIHEGVVVTSGEAATFNIQ